MARNELTIRSMGRLSDESGDSTANSNKRGNKLRHGFTLEGEIVSRIVGAHDQLFRPLQQIVRANERHPTSNVCTYAPVKESLFLASSISVVKFY